MRKILILGCSVMAMLAVAQGMEPEIATFGRGQAVSEDKREGMFNFEAVARKLGDKRVVRGHLKFHQKPDAEGRRAELTIEVRRLAAKDNVAEFAGPAKLVAVVNGKVRRFEGLCQVRVADNKPKGSDGKPDAFGLHFKAERADMTYNFVGLVKDGDLVVKLAK